MCIGYQGWKEMDLQTISGLLTDHCDVVTKTSAVTGNWQHPVCVIFQPLTCFNIGSEAGDQFDSSSEVLVLLFTPCVRHEVKPPVHSLDYDKKEMREILVADLSKQRRNKGSWVEGMRLNVWLWQRGKLHFIQTNVLGKVWKNIFLLGIL